MLIVLQIPCYNEEATLPQTLACLPRIYRGHPIQWVVLDDGSSDRTRAVAAEAGVDHVVALPHRGLAQTWVSGLQFALNLGADVVVNVDADNQYSIESLPSLLDPVIDGRADIVVGCRDFDAIPHFSYVKRRLQELGSWVVSHFAGYSIKDATSGYRALNRQAMASLVVHSRYTYTLETLLQAGHLGLRVIGVPTGTNAKLRESRLMRSTASYIQRSVVTLLRIALLYNPLQFFLTVGALCALPSLFLVGRFGYFYLTGGGQGHIQSLVIATIGFLLAIGAALLGVLAELLTANRRLLESIRAQVLLGAGGHAFQVESKQRAA